MTKRIKESRCISLSLFNQTKRSGIFSKLSKKNKHGKLETTNFEILTMQPLYRSYNPWQHWLYNYLGRCNILFDCFRMYRLQSICICSRGQYRSPRTKMEFLFSVIASNNIGEKRKRFFFFSLFTHSDRGVCVDNGDIMRLSHCAIHTEQNE